MSSAEANAARRDVLTIRRDADEVGSRALNWLALGDDEKGADSIVGAILAVRLELRALACSIEYAAQILKGEQ